MTQHSSPRFTLPLIQPAQAQKHLTVNESLLKLDQLIADIVLQSGMVSAPADLAQGDSYILADNSIGFAATSPAQGSLARFSGTSWQISEPQTGHRVWDVAQNKSLIFNGAEWEALQTEQASETLTKLGINTDADATNKLAVKSDAILLSHDDVTPGSGDMRVIMNKASTANTSAFLLHDNYSGRAEIGLAGNNDLAMKVSSNGSNFLTALRVDHASGAVTFPQMQIGNVRRVVYTSGSGTYTPPSDVRAIGVICVGGGGGGAGARTETITEFVGAGGGGAGGIVKRIISTDDIPSSLTYSVGSAGLGGSADAADPVGSRDGSDGGASSLSGGSVSITAYGGKGAPEDAASAGANQFSGGAGGSATGGDVNISGQDGSGGLTKFGDYFQIGVGTGGSGAFGQGGNYKNGNGATGEGYGSGGSGCGMVPGLILNRAGGNGSAGLIIIDEYY